MRDHITALQDLRKEQAFSAIIDVLDKTFSNGALDALTRDCFDLTEAMPPSAKAHFQQAEKACRWPWPR